MAGERRHALLTTDDNHTLLHARNGRGVVVLPEHVCSDALQAGERELLLPAFSPQDAWFKADVPRRRHGIARFRALLEWLSARLKAADPTLIEAGVKAVKPTPPAAA